SHEGAGGVVRMTAPSTDVIAVFNTSEDATDLLRVVFEQRLCRGDSFHPPPARRQGRRLFEHYRDSPASKSVPFFVTTNVAHVQKVAGSLQQVYEIVGKPYDLDQPVRAGKAAARSRPAHSRPRTRSGPRCRRLGQRASHRR